MTIFAMKGFKNQTIHGAHSTGELSISGHFHCQGPQPISDDGGAPQWVADLFEQYPDVDQIALSSKKSSVVWSRIK